MKPHVFDAGGPHGASDEGCKHCGRGKESSIHVRKGFSTTDSDTIRRRRKKRLLSSPKTLNELFGAQEKEQADA